MPDWYPDLLDQVSQHQLGGRRAMAAVNTELIRTYWRIGRDILDRQDREGYGTKIIDRLSADVRARFPGVKRYSPRNLKYMRASAAAWTDWRLCKGPLHNFPGGATSRSWRSWTALTIDFGYATQAIEEGWSRAILALNIERRLHERSARRSPGIAGVRHG